MADVTSNTCADCQQVFTARVLRYIKVNGEWMYLCTECRRKRKELVPA